MTVRHRAAYFDMDGTLIRNTNSVRYLCTLNGKCDELMGIETMEESGAISWVEADYLKCRLLRGLQQATVQDSFDKEITVISGLYECLLVLQEHGYKKVLVTAGPIDVANTLAERFAFDAVYGSKYEIVDGVYTGRLTQHLDTTGKLEVLMEFCQEHDIKLEDVVAVGDSASDLKVFEKCGKTIAINYSKSLVGKADTYFVTEDLRDILPEIIRDL